MRITIRNMLAAVLFGLAVMSNVPVAADVISLRADAWCPYNCAPDAPQPGYMIEIARKVFEPAGHQIDYQLLNWARALEEARAGKINGVVGAAKGDASDLVFPDEALGSSAYAFATVKTDTWNYSGPESLHHKVLGVIRNYSYGKTIDQYVEANMNDPGRVQVTSGDKPLELNLRKLQSGRLGAVCDGQAVLKYNISRLGLEGDLRMAGTDTEADPIYIAFAPSNPVSKQYAELLSKGIVALRASGELKAILDKYGLSDWK
jgi:polar amino acid transport system substrate-binding protein